MTRKHLLIVAVALAVGAIAFIAVSQGSRAYEHRRVRSAVSAYDLALAEALRASDETVLQETALPREIGRIRSYLMLLEATRTSLEVELLDLEVRQVESSDTTVTALVYERWREAERDTRTGVVRSEAKERAQVLRYTLVPDDGALKVYLSEIVEEGAQ